MIAVIFEVDAAQVRGRTAIFANYRPRVAQVVRDYGTFDRVEAPQSFAEDDASS